jgi:hypothetical protein
MTRNIQEKGLQCGWKVTYTALLNSPTKLLAKILWLDVKQLVLQALVLKRTPYILNTAALSQPLCKIKT